MSTIGTKFLHARIYIYIYVQKKCVAPSCYVLLEPEILDISAGTHALVKYPPDNIDRKIRKLVWTYMYSFMYKIYGRAK